MSFVEYAGRRAGAALMVSASLAVLAACGGNKDAADGKSGPLKDSVVTIPSVPTITVAAFAPNSYTGTLPCADCGGIATTVALFSDTTYRLREVYEGKGGAPAVSMGRWKQDGGAIVLEGLGRTVRFAAAGSDTLRLLNQSGKPIDSAQNHALVRDASVNALREPSTFTGAFMYMADAPTFRECASGQTYPVLMKGGYKALEKAFTSAKLPPGSAQQVEVQARFLARPDDMEGARERDVLEVVKYIGPAANPDCK
ncbi:copper resistance protein NlpE N-terminal domain-containing protein [Gemmatimonas phototrophica]|uniref:NlpE C-terminal OB domain-containing protein n=1 Tax=Gemmatimonas phototrophica TaxID=1379270 RepID=A0A143BPC1_9BACT|nr:copper resistance protein NlpE N-terminal domain-containing protein [Gemmatimonas phototrophica]AMW06301.1 hypothetical protein GEMMAAP_18970 [Gemmatimonas phototrophica]